MASPIDRLLGLDHPKWACRSCWSSGNFASRIKCKCGADAPPEVRKAVILAHSQRASKLGERAGGEAAEAGRRTSRVKLKAAEPAGKELAT